MYVCCNCIYAVFTCVTQSLAHVYFEANMPRSSAANSIHCQLNKCFQRNVNKSTNHSPIGITIDQIL